MKKFIGLLRKEWLLYRSWWLIAIVVGFVFIYCGEYFYIQPLEITDPRLLFSSWVLVIGTFLVVIQFLTSIHNDLKTKEIWLHSTSTIAQLVGVKILFAITCSTIFNLIFSVIRLFPSSGFNKVPFMHLFILRLTDVVLIFIIQCMLILIALLFLTLNVYLKRRFGQFAFIITSVCFILFMKLGTEFNESNIYGKIFYHGEISLELLSNFLKQSDDALFIILGPIYVVESLAYALGYLVFYKFVTKWLEKVVLR